MKQLILPDSYSGEEIFSLSGDDSHYLLKVQRRDIGYQLNLKSKDLGLYKGEIINTDSGIVTLKLKKMEDSGNKEPEIYLFQCIPKGKKTDLIIRQAVEAGVTRVFPILSDHSVPVFKNENDKGKKRERWEKIIKEASQQSNTRVTTSIEPLLTMEDALKSLKDEYTGIFFHQEKISNIPLHSLLSENEKKIVIVIGPEGGISSKEVELLLKYNFTPVLLGDNILRAETAATFSIGAVKMILLERNFWKPV